MMFKDRIKKVNWLILLIWPIDQFDQFEQFDQLYQRTNLTSKAPNEIYIYFFMINEQVELGRVKMLQSLKAYFAELAKRDR